MKVDVVSIDCKSHQTQSGITAAPQICPRSCMGDAVWLESETPMLPLETPVICIKQNAGLDSTHNP